MFEQILTPTETLNASDSLSESLALNSDVQIAAHDNENLNLQAQQSEKAQLAHELHAKAVALFSQSGKNREQAASEAISVIQESVEICPTAQSLLNTAKIYMVLNDQIRAIDWGKRCLDFCARLPNLSEAIEAHRLLGQAYAHLAQYHDAVRHLEAFYQYKPDDMANEFDLAYALLALGQYEKGWHHYQVRYRTGFAVSGAEELAKIPASEWEGDLQSLKGKVILLMPEQGFGDEIQFARVTRHLQSAGAKVWIMAPQPLESLMRTLPWKERIVNTQWQHFSEIDCWTTAIRACAHLKLNPFEDTFCTPYLLADPVEMQKFALLRQPFATQSAIGLNWRGNPRHFNDKARSISLHEMLQEINLVFEQLNIVKGQAKLFSVQLAPTLEELEQMRVNQIVDLSGQVQNFAQLAGAISLFDHFLTIDSAPAHLAGALNISTTLLVPPRIDWRWGTPENRPTWYSSLEVKLQQRYN